MALICILGLHRPSLVSIAKRPLGLVGLCEGCGRPMERRSGGKWALADPLDVPLGSERLQRQ